MREPSGCADQNALGSVDSGSVGSHLLSAHAREGSSRIVAYPVYTAMESLAFQNRATEE